MISRLQRTNTSKSAQITIQLPHLLRWLKMKMDGSDPPYSLNLGQYYSCKALLFAVCVFFSFLDEGFLRYQTTKVCIYIYIYTYIYQRALVCWVTGCCSLSCFLDRRCVCSICKGECYIHTVWCVIIFFVNLVAVIFGESTNNVTPFYWFSHCIESSCT